MDDRTTKTGAQGIEHEDLKDEVSLDLEKKKSDLTSPDSSQPSVNPGTTLPQGRDVEAVQEEVTPTPVKVPRSKRRGLFGRFTIVAEVEEPKHYPRRTKWFITFVIALAAVAAPMGSTIIFRKNRALVHAVCNARADSKQLL